MITVVQKKRFSLPCKVIKFKFSIHFNFWSYVLKNKTIDVTTQNQMYYDKTSKSKKKKLYTYIRLIYF